MSLLDRIHGDYVHSRRVQVLCRHFSQMLPPNAQVLDVGCGDGLLAQQILQARPDLEISGIDVLVRPRTYVPVKEFDGRSIPHEATSFDVVLFVDVLHHTENQMALLAEAARVGRKHIIIKDHTLNGLLAGPTLRFMDWVGNARHGVVLPYHYWTRDRWLAAFTELNLKVGLWRKDLELYARPASWVFERSLHFIARLDVNQARGGGRPDPSKA